MPPKAKKPYVRRPQKCFVPACENVEGCGKIFLHTPRNPSVLKSWCKAVGANSGGKCCEDHFELAEDAENWQYFKLCGNGLKIKQGVVPHKYLTTKRPETVSQFSDSDKKLKLEFLSSLVTERTILTRVNRLEDLKVSDGSTNPRDLEELAKTGLATQYYEYEEEEEEESTVPTLQVTPDIYLCSCIEEHDPASAENRISCSTQTPEVSEFFILGPTTDDAEMEKMEGPVKLPEASPYPTPQILKTLLTADIIQGTATKPQKISKKPVEVEECLSQDSNSSLFESNCLDEDPDYELKTVPHADERPSKLKSTEMGSKEITSGTSKSTSTRRKSKKPTGKSRTRPKKKYK